MPLSFNTGSGSETQPGWSYPPGVTETSSPIDCALAYARLDFRVFPVRPDKRPLIVRWPKRATTNVKTVEQLWLCYWGADVGWALPAQTVLVDLDLKDGQDGIADFKKIDGRDPFDVQTPIARTRSGGLHLFFGIEPGKVKGTNLRGSHGLAIDLKVGAFDNGHVKIGQGYVVLPTPSNGRVWIKSPLQVGKEQAPKWMTELARPLVSAAIAPRKVAAKHTLYGQKTLDRLTLMIAGAPRGEQDDTRIRFAFIIGQYVGGGELEEEDAWAQVLQAAKAAPTGLDHNALRKEKYLRRAFGEGMFKPRSWETDWGEAAIKKLDAAHEYWKTIDDEEVFRRLGAAEALEAAAEREMGR
jgi:hypothetical protein